jgi:hypothetical protein
MRLRQGLILTPISAVFHRDIVYEMGELGVLGPTIKGKDISVYTMQPIPTYNILKDHPFSSVTHFICKMGNGYLS